MKTYEIVKFNKVVYVMTRYNGRAMDRECFKTMKAANDRVKALKGEGFVKA